MKVEAGRIYPTRGGLSVYISEPHVIGFTTAQGHRHEARFWRGVVVDTDPPSPWLWYDNGQYSPVDGVKMPLDLIDDAGNSVSSEGTQ